MEQISAAGSMANDQKDPVDTLYERGDVLERHLVATIRDDSVVSNVALQVLQPYAQVWQDFILGRRVNGEIAKVEQLWMNFAGSHYTAMVRFESACFYLKECLQAIETLKEAAQTELGLAVLTLHRATASLWWNVGACIENLGDALESSPNSSTERGSGLDQLYAASAHLEVLYKRRNLFAHSRLIPIDVDGHGVPKVPEAWLVVEDGKEGNAIKEANWKIVPEPWIELEKYLEGEWSRCCEALAKGWNSVMQSLCKCEGKMQLPKDTPIRDGVSLGIYSATIAPSGTK